MKNREKQIKVLYCVGVLFILTIITLIVMIACAPSVTATPDQDTSTNSSEETEEPRIVIYYKVQPGDTWWDLSRQFYGDGSYYEAIAIYNKCSTTETLYV
jgi:nucleoid-associated protein YgaU